MLPRFDTGHPPLKWLRKVAKGQSPFCIVEGWKCCHEAIAKVECGLVLYRENLKDRVERTGWLERRQHMPIDEASLREFSGTQSPEGVMVVAQRPKVKTSAPEVQAGVTLVVVDWRNPANLGAMVRSCHALGAESIVLMGHGPDFFSPKVIRSSMGSVFHLPLHHLPELCPLPGFTSFMAAAGGEDFRDAPPPSGPLALYIGSESHGLPEELMQKGLKVGIELHNRCESLSAPIAGSLLLDKLLQHQKR